MHPAQPFRRPALAAHPSLLRGWGTWLCVALALVVAGCGFALRGTVTLPFPSLYIGVGANTALGAQLRREVRATSPSTRIVENAGSAVARLEIQNESRARTELSLTGQGRVQEYELRLSLQFRVIDAQGNELVPPTVLTASRSLPFDDNVAQAKESEAEFLYRAMQSDLAQRIVRRLAAATAPELIPAASDVAPR